MIKLTRLNGAEMWLSADLVATVEERPDTVVTLVDGNHMIVTETASEVVSAVTAYRASVLAVAEQVLMDMGEAHSGSVGLQAVTESGAGNPVVPLHGGNRRQRSND
jgi:flagellar protein FlbD